VWGHAVAVDENDVLSGGGSRPPRVSSDRVVLVDEPCWVHTVVPAARGVRAVVALAVPSPTTEDWRALRRCLEEADDDD